MLVGMVVSIWAAAAVGGPSGEVEAEITCPDAARRALTEAEKVLQWYGRTSGRVFEDLWNAPPDPDLLAKNPQEILHWVEGRLGPRHVQAGALPIGSGEGALQADLARAYLVLMQQDTAGGKDASRFDERYAVLGRALGRVISAGEGPIAGLALQIQALAKQYPGRWEASALYVDYFRAVTSVAGRQAPSYANLGGADRDAAFVERVLSQAREAERRRMERLCDSFQGMKTADLAAIYVAAGYRRGRPDERQKADQIVAQHQEAWKSDRMLWDRAVVEIGRPLAGPGVLTELSFVDVTGKRWAAADLRGKTTVFVFFSPSAPKAVASFRAKVGSWARVIGVPMTSEPRGPDDGITVDPGPTGVVALAKALGVTGLPGVALVTPDLEITSGPENVAGYLKDHKPGN
jgi:hypothetical protein